MGTETVRRRENGKSAVLIAGPTASGKSALALSLAEADNGVIINADSMQVYRDLRILTARPDEDETARVPHRLYGHVDASEPYSVGRWLDDVKNVLDEAALARRLPILVGGTGLYFKALTEGLTEIPPIPENVRIYWRDMAAAEPSEALHAKLAQLDPEMAERLNPGDAQRIARALEVVTATGKSLAAFHEEASRPLIDPEDAERIVLSPERPELHRRIEARFRQMAEAGALDEVAALTARNLDPQLPAMKAIGVRPLAAHLSGACDLEAAISRSVVETRRYAKRQLTWFRGQMGDWDWREV
ncbi:tRNA (adenosine(37)-N6)-dimethylallyltransferase MiaA [Rhodobium gokarnense]|uniref:tRNA dimethylallyltransferase n=1 Tax=Rhodobium gokarnense TaxID=364296 RepID=A0ABT3H9F1_9HYPH|nr:tRNA (adenosine(37)-N6)-dimethylallyltransferase MiaA [Rhodobium gokarnense]MCW2306994.1 tRNA dimethylallyltransferase [Rhodobium gokarnense]